MLSAAVLMAGLVAPVAGARGQRAEARATDTGPDCNEYLPAKTQVLTGTPSWAVSLDVVVLHDGIDKLAAEAIMSRAARSYAPMNITLTSTYKKVLFRADPASVPATAAITDLLAASKAVFGGVRPEKSDVVLLLTDKDIYLSTGDAVGYADCIGGVRYPDRAFAIAEAFDQQEPLGALNLYVDLPAKTAAHEIGHLLGARHEHSNCVEGTGPDVVTNREPSACTLMTTYVDFQSRWFGALESGVIRAHAETYALP